MAKREYTLSDAYAKMRRHAKMKTMPTGDIAIERGSIGIKLLGAFDFLRKHAPVYVYLVDDIQNA